MGSRPEALRVKCIMKNELHNQCTWPHGKECIPEARVYPSPRPRNSETPSHVADQTDRLRLNPLESVFWSQIDLARVRSETRRQPKTSCDARIIHGTHTRKRTITLLRCTLGIRGFPLAANLNTRSGLSGFIRVYPGLSGHPTTPRHGTPNVFL